MRQNFNKVSILIRITPTHSTSLRYTSLQSEFS